MKKKIFAVVATLMATIMCFVGCGSNEPDLVGKWECDYDLTDLMNESFAQGLGMEADEFMKYMKFSDFVLKLDFEFTADGYMKIELNRESIEQRAAEGREMITNGLNAYFEDQLSDLGIDDVEAYLAEVGMDPAAIAEESMGADFVEQQITAMSRTCKFSAKDGKLYSFDEGEIANPDLYETFTLEGDTLTITGASDGSEGYPFVLTRVK